MPNHVGTARVEKNSDARFETSLGERGRFEREPAGIGSCARLRRKRAAASRTNGRAQERAVITQMGEAVENGRPSLSPRCSSCVRACVCVCVQTLACVCTREATLRIAPARFFGSWLVRVVPGQLSAAATRPPDGRTVRSPPLDAPQTDARETDALSIYITTTVKCRVSPATR